MSENVLAYLVVLIDRMGTGLMQGAYFEGEEVGTQLAEYIQAGKCNGISPVGDVKNAQPYIISNSLEIVF